jgi:hypothetical protein
MATVLSAAPADILGANLTALQSAQPGFTVPPDENRVRVADCVWRLFDEANPGGAAIHSRDPQREADRVAEELLGDRQAGVVVAIGLGLGFLLDALERRGWTGKVLAFEPAPRTVRAMLGRRDWQDWITAGRLRIFLAPDFRGVGESWRWFADETDPPVFVNPALARLRAPGVARAREVLGRIRYDAAANAAARRDHGPRYLLNTLRNLPAIAAGGDASQLVNAASGVPAIVVAAGPSLDAALPALYEAQDSAIIIAVDTAVRPLLQAGIAPHIAVAVDPSDINGRHLMDLPPCPDTFLVTEGSLDPYAVAAFGGRTFFFNVSDHQPWPWITAAGRPIARLRAWGSVLTTAFDLALKMGCNPLIFTGADLSYTGERPYCRGVSFEEDWQRRVIWGERLEQLWRDAVNNSPRVAEPDVAGCETRTAPHLVAFRNWLVEQIAHEPATRVINATGAGILLGPHIEQRAPGELASLLASTARPRRELIRERHRPLPAHHIKAATTMLLDQSVEGAGEATIAAWQAFAPGVSSEAIVDALRAAATAFDRRDDARQTNVESISDPLPNEKTHFDAETLQQLAAAMPLVRMRIPAHRLQSAPDNTRVFRFRSMAARILCCAARPADGGVTENGRPLTRVFDLNDLAAGTYASFRDEVHFRAPDGSDPRWNGREYTLLVPSPVAHLESLPPHDLLNRQI